MEASFSRQRATHFPFNWTWNQWIGGFFLILLGCLNLIYPIPALILIAFLLLLLGSLSRPYIALAIAILLLGFEAISIAYLTSEHECYAYGIGYYVGLAGFLCWCSARLAGVTPPYQSTTLDLPLAIVLISSIISLLWTPFQHDGINVVISMTVSYFVYLLISALVCTPRDLQKYFWLWFVLGILIVISTVSTFFFNYVMEYNFTDQLALLINITKFDGTRETMRGFVGGPVALASLLNVAILCSLTLLCTQVRLLWRILIFISIVCMLFIHILSVSRLALVGLFLGWLTFVYLNPQWRNARIRHHLMAAASVALVFLALLLILNTFYYGSTELFARLLGQEHTAGTGYKFSGIQSRRDHIIYALGALWDSGGLGSGVAGMMRGMDPNVWIDAPSLYFSYLADHGYGILSLILMFWITLNVIMELRWALLNCPDPRHKLFIVGVCSILVMFGSPVADNLCFCFYHWAVLGFVAAAVKGVRHLCMGAGKP